LNGGGAPLKLRTTSGKIRLKYLDAETAYHSLLVREQEDRLNKRLAENGMPRIPFSREVGPTVPLPQDVPPQAESPKTDWLESWLGDLERAFRGGVSEDPDKFQKRLTFAPHPKYPALAQRAGVEGFVKLQVRVKQDGHVEVQKVLEGEPVLVDAAIDAVKQWQAKPAWLNGKKTEVISTVTFNFQLRDR
jgi:TonB family protein